MMQPTPIAKPLLEAAGGFLCMCLDLLAVYLFLSHAHWQVVMTAFICSLGNLG